MRIGSVGPVSRRRLRTGLGTFLAVEAAAPSATQADAAIEAAFVAMATVERRMHPTREGSDLARINAVGEYPSPPLAVHPSTWELLELAKQLNELSGGVFDPCLPCCPGLLSDIELLPDFEVQCLAPVRLDFGGFAKGYAVDQAMEALIDHGCTAGLVNAGGDLRVTGPQPHVIWLRDPARVPSSVVLSNASLAVSCTDEQRRPREHAGYYVRSEASVRRPRHCSVAVIATRATIADALTKCVLLCTQPQLARLMRRFSAQAVKFT
jgi:FAD:protein FMN transferase